MVSVEQLIAEKYPRFLDKSPLLVRPALSLLRGLLREEEINRFLTESSGLAGFDFVDKVLEYFQVSYRIDEREKENIPATGRVVIVANHPLGSLDGLALLKLVGGVRGDVCILVNDALAQLAPLRELLLPIDKLGKKSHRRSIQAAVDALEQDQALIVFPSGEVSRAGLSGVKDRAWHGGFLHIARAARAPVLPIHVGARNSGLFYSLSLISKPLSMLLLVREMFKQRATSLPMRIGELIPWTAISSGDLPRAETLKRLRRHVYALGKNRPGYFATEPAIAHPENRQALRRELAGAKLLGRTRDGKSIYLVDYRPNSAVMREIGRLREIAFRSVGEGVGRRRDIDAYDFYYRHLVLWDEQDLEIAGAYRIAEAAAVLERLGERGLYTASLFRYGEAMQDIFAQGLELGRSFVQPRYWGMRALDYLWYGIGAYLRENPQIRYLFGPVSLSNSYPAEAKDLLIYCYRRHFGGGQDLAIAKHRYVIAHDRLPALAQLFQGRNYAEDFRVLKERLGAMGLAVPTLYKQYSELCEDGGVRFLDFGVDAQFAHCVDGLVVVDMARLKPAKRERYLDAELARGDDADSRAA